MLYNTIMYIWRCGKWEVQHMIGMYMYIYMYICMHEHVCMSQY